MRSMQKTTMKTLIKNRGTDVDPARINMALVKQPFSFQHPQAQTVCLANALLLSRMPPRLVVPRKVEKQRSDVKLRFAPDERNETFEYEDSSTNVCLKDQIWYNSKDFAEMVEDLDGATQRHRKHIAGIRKCYVHTILDLQEEHRAEGILDPKGLACMAKSCTKFSRRDALTRAKEMARDASPKLMDHSETLDIIASVLDLTMSPRKSRQQKRDTTLRPPRRLLSPC